MAHTHSVVDADPHYKIDPVTRKIVLADGETEKVIMQFDHNSERASFELPRYIEGHDMSTCNKVEVHYINAPAIGTGKSGVYNVEDLAISEADEDIVVFSWLISQNATSCAGALDFSLCFYCETDGVVDYLWSTAEYTGKKVTARRSGSKEVIQQIPDVLEQYKAELFEKLSARYPTDAGLLPDVGESEEAFVLCVMEGVWAAVPADCLYSELLETENKYIVGAIIELLNRFNELNARVAELENGNSGSGGSVTA